MSFSHLAIWKNNSLKFLIFCTALLCVGAVHADTEGFLKDTLGASGSLRAAAWDRDKSYSDHRGYGVGSAWLTLRPQEVSGFKLYADGYVQGQDLARDQFSRGDLRELYVEKSAGPFDFKVGRAITVWGRGDKVNPTDNLTVRNYKLLMTDDEDQRTGVFQTQVAYNLGTTRFIAVWAPEWRSPTYPIPPLSGVTLTDERPKTPQDQYALKIDQSGGDVDWSVSYYHGFNKSPNLNLVSFSPSTGAVVAFNYGKVDVIGGDFATNFGSYGVRGEIAGTITDDSSGHNPLAQNSNLFAVLGIDRTLIENFNINGQILYKHVFDFQSTTSITNPVTKLIADQIALNSNQVVADQTGFSLRPSYKMYNETLEMEAAVVMWTYNTNALIRPKLTYAFSDSFKGIIGAEFYTGSQNSFLGRLQKVSSGFAELRWNF